MKRSPAFVVSVAAVLLGGGALVYAAGRRDAEDRRRRRVEAEDRRLAELQGRAMLANLRHIRWQAAQAGGRSATRPAKAAAPLTAAEEAEMAELQARQIEREIDRLATRHPPPPGG